MFDVEALKGEQCLSSACFLEKQRAYLTDNWARTGYRKQHKTNGFRFRDEIAYDKWNGFYGKARKDCLACKDFVTLISMRGETMTEKACVGDKGCFNKKGKPEAGGQRSEKETKAKAERRAEEHGTIFREEFYRDQLPERIEVSVDADPEKDARIKLFVLIKLAHYLQEWFYEDQGVKKTRWWGHADNELWDALLKMSRTQLDECMKRACITVAMRGEFGAEARKMVADHVGIDLKKEWRLTKEYLEKKTMAEIRAIAEEFGLFERKEAKTFLFEVLLKKRGSFESCKKGELIRVILESGVELEGCVPQEILGPQITQITQIEEDGKKEVKGKKGYRSFAQFLDDERGLEKAEDGDQRSEVSEDEEEAEKIFQPGAEKDCEDCAWLKRKSSSISGHSIPGRRFGKCTRPDGICDIRKPEDADNE